MKSSSILASLLFCATLLLQPGSAGATEVLFGFGKSAKAPAGAYVGDFDGVGQAIARETGGENVFISFVHAVTVTSIRLTAYSDSGEGAVLLRNVTASTKWGTTGPAVPSLFDFPQLVSGNPVNYQGLDMLGDQQFVENSQFTGKFWDFTFIYEGFRDDDSGLVIQINTIEPVTNADIGVDRDSPNNPPLPPGPGPDPAPTCVGGLSEGAYCEADGPECCGSCAIEGTNSDGTQWGSCVGP